MRTWTAAALLLALSTARAQEDVPMRAMKDELARATRELKLEGMEKPYFIAYRVDDFDTTAISAVLGSIAAVRPQRARQVSVEIRVGDYRLDNGNYFSTRGFGGSALTATAPGPLDDSYQEIRRQLWLATDAQYKRALETVSEKRAVLQSRRRTEELPDFSRETPRVESEPVERTGARNAELEVLARELSAVFRASPEIQRSAVKIETRDVFTRYLNGEGSSFTRTSPYVRIQVDAETRSDDGLPISDRIEIHARASAELPPREALLARVREMADRILRLRTAASVDRYNGPVLFEGVAAAELFAQQFASGLVAVREPVSDDPRFEMFYGQLAAQLGGGSLLDKIGGRVLPEFLSVVDAPLLREYRGVPLLGRRTVDDDGVASRDVRLVQRGTLETLLTSRVPVRSLRASSGSRRGPGPAPSNLIVATDRPVPNGELRRELLRRARARGLDYGIVVRRVGGGGAGASLVRLAARLSAQGGVASDALAEVIRVRADGTEELLRGVELAQMNPGAFRDIVAAGDTPSVFTGEFVNGLFAMFSVGLSQAAPLMSCVVPALLFEEVTLVRSHGPFPAPLVSGSPLALRQP